VPRQPIASPISDSDPDLSPHHNAKPLAGIPTAMESQNLIRWLMLVGAAWRGGFDAPESVPVRGIFSCAPPTP
jgi:hypothetical protein